MNGIDSFRSLQPIVLDQDKKKKKRRYSKGLRDVQRAGRRFAKISESLSKGKLKGARTFRKANAKSSRKKKDGALRDFGKNLAKGMSASMRSSSSLPKDVARALSTRSSRKSLRKRLRIAGKLNRAFGIR